MSLLFFFNKGSRLKRWKQQKGEGKRAWERNKYIKKEKEQQ
jgi:hypothetical protein